jgi:hypothetical protein
LVNHLDARSASGTDAADGQWDARHEDVACLRTNQASQHTCERGLSGAILADDGMDASRRPREADGIDRHELAEPDRDPDAGERLIEELSNAGTDLFDNGLGSWWHVRCRSGRMALRPPRR